MTTLLLDTNAAIWALDKFDNLGSIAAADITNPANQVFVSDIVILECVIKYRTGKLQSSLDFRRLDQALLLAGIQQISFDGWTAQQFLDMPELQWADPFDRAHIALALAKHMTLVTSDKNILNCGITGLNVLDARK